jgi:outer membrane protein assembly factor BamA
MQYTMRHLCLLLILLALPYIESAHGQTNESDTPPTASFLDPLANLGERLLDHLTFTTPKGIWAIYPTGGYSSRTGLEFGLMPVYSWDSKNDEHTKREVNTLTTSLQFSTKGMIEIRSELEWYASPLWQFSGRLEALRINDQYWERWSLDKAAQPIDFRADRFGFKSEVFRHLGHQIHVGVGSEIWHYQLDHSEKNPYFEQLHGSGGGWLAGIGPVAMVDKRDHVLYPHSGSYLKASWTLFQQQLLGAYTYNNFLLDLRQFISIGRPVLAFQALWEYNDGDTPFFMMPQLGGKDRLRGIGHSKNVVDQSVWLLRSELRSHIWWRFGAVLFTEAGQAGNRPALNWDELIYSNGLGLRFRLLPHEPLHIRIDAAWSSEGHQGLFISLKEAF